MAGLCEALRPIVGPRVTLEAHGGRGIVVLVDVDVEERTGGAYMTRAAPWLPGPTSRTDLIRTARGVAEAVHQALSDEWAGTTSIGPSRPTVTPRGGAVAIRFFGVNGEPLPVVEVPLIASGG